MGGFRRRKGTLVLSGVEQGGHPVVTRQQFFEFFGRDGELRAKRLLPMEFELIEKDRFESLARAAGFRFASSTGTTIAPFDPERSPVMIWVLQK